MISDKNKNPYMEQIQNDFSYKIRVKPSEKRNVVTRNEVNRLDIESTVRIRNEIEIDIDLFSPHVDLLSI